MNPTMIGGEDPYLFKDAVGNFHCLFHAFDKSNAKVSSLFFPGSHAFSQNGRDW